MRFESLITGNMGLSYMTSSSAGMLMFYSQYIKAGCITALLVDYLETIPLEIRYIWYGKKTLVTTVYFLARYTVFLSYVFGALHTLKWANIPVERCFLTYILTSVTHMVNSAFCEGLLYAQVYAFSGGKRLMGVYLLFQFIALHCAKFALQTRYSIRVGAFEILDLTEDVHCIAITPSQDASSHLGGVFIAQTVGLYVLIAITLWIHRFGYRDLKSALLTVLIRNGMIYFVTVTALSSLAIAFSYVSKGANIFLAPYVLG
ncbi:hypothetical protein CC1G_10991 [Coprinopsis cinerea okayama7|uniref:DUF6533 domain-containing protein n=1 Tax=Coprinopsis cinerea (strain Okayama-7 / 130 / ATCC MYA-4618 / FGSC 9003) TaxID=240176 RepID=A8P716_COPC7|nr:hypothetical protein CC1G_10991 [Coprinopsis cinerea okayama7\|eukprot:XP_001839269.2 hypothetical protein CC1G_10991 [Coprinopsis cinerea okayama7\